MYGESIGEIEIDKVKKVGILTIVPASILFWYFYYLYRITTDHAGDKKRLYSIAFFLGNFVSPLIYWVIMCIRYLKELR